MDYAYETEVGRINELKREIEVSEAVESCIPEITAAAAEDDSAARDLAA
ncbi:MAG: hypothetical protein V2I33_25435 [Kangiellaceae bacterium]|nr:hypothetical protein [Kangiellaceae bacterium]